MSGTVEIALSNVARKSAYAAGVREQLPDGDLLGSVGVGKLEVRKIADDGRVELYCARLYKLHDRDSSERLLAPEYSLRDVMNGAKGPQFASRHMQYDVLDGPLEEEVTRFEVPVYVIMGRHDLVTPVSLARRYFERIQAPEKAFILFPDSAHFPMYEEPQRFAAVMRTIAEAVGESTR